MSCPKGDGLLSHAHQPTPNMNKYLTEFIGTFFLVFTIGCNVLGGNSVAPLAIGAVLMVMVYAGGHISGAHYNPAVTLAVTLRGKCTPSDAVPYVIGQLLGAACATVAVRLLFSHKAEVFATMDLSGKIAPVFLAELLCTFALAWVVLNVATSKDTAGNSNYGLAIGFTVAACAFSVGSISGGAFNPAVALGAAMLGILKFADIWVHIAANLAGGALAAVAFKALSTADKE